MAVTTRGELLLALVVSAVGLTPLALGSTGIYPGHTSFLVGGQRRCARDLGGGAGCNTGAPEGSPKFPGACFYGGTMQLAVLPQKSRLA